jgi:hypothetical protein
VASLSSQLVGSWKLRTREDRNEAGEIRVDPFLGPNPIAFLVMDAAGNFAAQFMKRDREPGASIEERPAAANNTAAVAGYDAYFGTYVANDATGEVTHTLLGAIAPSSVGRVLSRHMSVDGETLTIRLDTATTGGEDVTRTLVWDRVPGTGMPRD